MDETAITLELTEMIEPTALEKEQLVASSTKLSATPEPAAKIEADPYQPAIRFTQNELSHGEENATVVLTDIVQPAPPKRTAATLRSIRDDDTIVDLMDMVESGALSIEEITEKPRLSNAENEGAPEDEDLLDLNQVVARTSAPIFSDPLTDDTLLVDMSPMSVQNPAVSRHAAEPETSEENEGIIRLDSVLSRGRHTPVDTSLRPPKPFAEEASSRSAKAEDDTISLGMVLDDIVDEPPITLTQMEIDKAIERLVFTKYGQTIEQLIASTVEKVVLREMQTLKRSLLEDDPALD